MLQLGLLYGTFWMLLVLPLEMLPLKMSVESLAVTLGDSQWDHSQVLLETASKITYQVGTLGDCHLDNYRVLMETASGISPSTILRCC